jgi:hypothetical protein
MAPGCEALPQRHVGLHVPSGSNGKDQDIHAVSRAVNATLHRVVPARRTAARTHPTALSWPGVCTVSPATNIYSGERVNVDYRPVVGFAHLNFGQGGFFKIVETDPGAGS